MTVRKIAGWFFRSSLGIIGSAAAALAAVFVLASGIGVFPAAGLGLAILALAFFVSLSTKNGLRFLLNRKDGDESEAAGKLLAEAAEARKSMAALRLPDPALSKARDRLVLEAGKFLEDSERRLSDRRVETQSLPLYDPEAIQAILDARPVLDAVLHELDETASERRFGAEDAHPVQNPVERAIAVLEDKTRDILRGRDRIRGLPDLSVQLEIEEELK